MFQQVRVVDGLEDSIGKWHCQEVGSAISRSEICLQASRETITGSTRQTSAFEELPMWPAVSAALKVAEVAAAKIVSDTGR
jgi:hypothetical protein